MEYLKKEIIAKKYTQRNELPEKMFRLLELAEESMKKAYAIYSGFSVGAAVLLENGEIICGNNQENSAYPSGLCAERVALFYASAKFPGIPMKALAISAMSEKSKLSAPVFPCGGCRQVMVEYEKKQKEDMQLFFSAHHLDTVISFDNATVLMPYEFQF